MRPARDWRAWLVAGLSAWEVVAIVSHGRLPTITRAWHTLRDRRFGRLVLWLVFGWLIEHLWAEERCDPC